MFKVGEVVYLAKNIGSYKRGTKALIKETEDSEFILRIIDEKISDDEIEAGYEDILRTCPFCGGEPLVSLKRNNNCVQIKCLKCGCLVLKEKQVYFIQWLKKQ